MLPIIEDETPKTKKRCKVSPNLSASIKCLLPEEYIQDMIFKEVYISKIAKKQHISRIMSELSQHLPLPGQLQHIKRVHQNEIVLCEVSSVEASNLSLEKYLKTRSLSEDVVSLISESISVLEIPFTTPKLRHQYEIAHKIWPCKFHPDKYLEQLYDGSIFSSSDQLFHEQILNLLIDISTKLENCEPCAACVDPRTKSIVALSASCISENPFQHAPMMLIDFVSRTQNPKVYREYDGLNFMEKPDQVEKTPDTRNMSGILRRHHDFICDNPSYKDLSLGAEQLRNSSIEEKNMREPSSDNLSKYGPYLCTGYDVYLSQEPCLMCSFALLHSRTRRIFFINASESNGALMSSYKLHNIKDLNHHYEVFQCEMRNS